MQQSDRFRNESKCNYRVLANESEPLYTEELMIDDEIRCGNTVVVIGSAHGEDLPLEVPAYSRSAYVSPALPPSQSGQAGQAGAAPVTAPVAAVCPAQPRLDRSAASPSKANGKRKAVIAAPAAASSSALDEARPSASGAAAPPVGAAAAAASFPTERPRAVAAGASAANGEANGGQREEGVESELDSIMAQVALLEEQGRMVEASSLMASALARAGQ